MAIKKKLIHFRSKAKFDEYLAANDILDSSIVFIQDEKLIWTHGTFYTTGTSGSLSTEDIVSLKGYTGVELSPTDTLNEALSKIATKLGEKISFEDIVDNLNSTDSSKPLSSNQGKILKDLIDSKTSDSLVTKESIEKVLTGDIASHSHTTVNGHTVLSNVPENAKFTDTVYTHPSFTAKSSGLYKITVNNQGHVSATAGVTKQDITNLGIPAQDTTYSVMKGATSSAGGSSGLVPAPVSGKQTSFLRGDGTWVIPTDTKYNIATSSSNGLMSSSDKSKLDGIDNNANNYSLPTSSSTELGGIKVGYTESGKNYPVELDEDSKAYVNVPWTDTNTTYSAATSTTFGTVKIGTSVAKANGTASAGSTTGGLAASVDHVHPLQTTVSGNAGSATKLQTARTITLTGAITGSTTFDGTANKSITTTLSGFDASKITSGTIDIERLPKGALERLITVETDSDRFALTTENVQLGDTVKVINTGLMYIVVDDSKLSTEDGYTVYTAGSAASVPWSGITGKPSTFTPSTHTHSYLPLSGGTLTGALVVGDGTDDLTRLVTSSGVGYLQLGSNTEGKGRITAYNSGTIKTLEIKSEDTKISGDFSPSTNNSYTLGTSSLKWNNIYSTTFTGSLSGNASSASKVNNNLVLKIKSGTTEGTDLYTFNGSAGKTLDIVQGSNVTLTAAAGKLTISSTNTTYSTVTTSANGLMSSADKTKLDGIATGANKYVLPTASSTVLGGIQIGYTENGKNYPVELSEGKAFVNVPWTDTNTTYSAMKGATSSAAGSTGLVPAPAAGKQTSFLRGDGTWVIPTNTNTTYTFASGTGAFTVTPSGGTAQTISIGKPSTAGTADKATTLVTARSIDGVNFNGSANITHYGTCSTAAATVEKAVSLASFTLVTGSRVIVKFTVNNTASNPTLNVNSTGAKAIYYRGSAISAGQLGENRLYEFVYDGTNYEFIGDFNTNTTYNVATTSANGLMSSTMVTKLNGIAEGANKYTLPAATASVLGGVKTGTGITNSSGTISVTYGTAANTACQGNDSRLSNNRNPIDNNINNVDLNTLNTKPGFYYNSGGMTSANRPAEVDHMGMLVIHSAAGHWTQLAFSEGKMYTRMYNGQWSAWKANYDELNPQTTISGNAGSATKLQTARSINGTSFNGTAAITTANWGTARSIGIVNSDGTGTAVTVSVNGSANVNLKLPSTIKASLTGNASTATKLATARTISLTGAVTGSTSFDGSGNVSISTTTAADFGKLTTITKTLTVSTSWIDTGITMANIPDNGSYIVQISGMSSSATGFYSEIFTGVMSWFTTATNSSDSDEILLHKAGHASAGAMLYLRTIRQTGSTNGLKLQIAASKACTSSSYTFKFRRLI